MAPKSNKKGKASISWAKQDSAIEDDRNGKIAESGNSKFKKKQSAESIEQPSTSHMRNRPRKSRFNIKFPKFKKFWKRGKSDSGTDKPNSSKPKVKASKKGIFGFRKRSTKVTVTDTEFKEVGVDRKKSTKESLAEKLRKNSTAKPTKQTSKWKVIRSKVAEKKFSISEGRLNKMNMTKEDKKRWKQMNKQKNVADRVHPRHLEMEPLCCLSSCLIRPGATSVAVFELCIAALASVCCYLRLAKSHWWESDTNFDHLITHPLVYYVGVAHNVMLACAGIMLLIGIKQFDAKLLTWHMILQVISLIFTVVFFGIYITAMISNAKVLFGWVSLGIGVCVVANILTQSWGITVVKACHNYFTLCQTLVNMADYGHG